MASEDAPGSGAAAPAGEAPAFDTSVAHVARVYNYWLGGKDNFAADRAAAEQAMAAFPGIALSARANRAFLRRAVTYLASQAGIGQFLDIGTGIPSANNTHEVAQATVASSRIVYVDNDPVVLAHARALLTSSTEGATDYIDADLRDVDQILALAAATLDFSRPVGVMLMAILQHCPTTMIRTRLSRSSWRLYPPAAISCCPTRLRTFTRPRWPRWPRWRTG
jgi:hypothetical protein